MRRRRANRRANHVYVGRTPRGADNGRTWSSADPAVNWSRLVRRPVAAPARFAAHRSRISLCTAAPNCPAPRHGSPPGPADPSPSTMPPRCSRPAPCTRRSRPTSRHRLPIRCGRLSRTVSRTAWTAGPNVVPARRHIWRPRAMPGGRAELIWEQEAARVRISPSRRLVTECNVSISRQVRSV